jgi:histidyl-tRNA synthetase
MYTFKDKNESLLTLRPEYTTPMLRAAISNNLLEKLPKKFFGIGPMFRRERPQKGRFRQFNQINFEILGTYDVAADVELILLADQLLKNLFSNKKINLQINSLGDKNTLKIFKIELQNFFYKNKDHLSEESKNKIDKNSLRILDSKDPKDQDLNDSAPQISDYYSNDAKEKFTKLQNLLTDLSVDFKINSNLVRGLDYYCHTVFEFKTNDLGAQDTLIGGGRYDGLVKSIGGPNISGVGWAGGIERIMMLMEDVILKERKVYLVLMSETFKSYGLKIANELRGSNVKVTLDYKYNIKKSLSMANQLNFKYAIIIGENEYINNLCTLKNLEKISQETNSIKNIIKIID